LTSSEKKPRRGMSSLVFSSLKMATATFSSRILGLVREQVMAATFGASGITDAFTVAYRVPNMLRDLFAEGAFSSAFVPVFTKVRQLGDREARTLLWSMAIILTLLTGAIVTAVIIFAPEVVHLMTDKDFVADQERMLITVQMVRIMAPFLTLVSLAALFMGALNTLKMFFVPALAPALFNVVMIVCMFTLPPHLEARGFHAALALALGVILGGFVQMLLQIPLVLYKGFGPTGQWSFKSEWTGSILNRLGIGTIGIAATQINILITTILATGTQLGAVSWLTYAFRLFQFPVGILSVSIAGSNLVHFSDEWKAGREKEASKILKTSYLMSWVVIIPAFALLMALSEETVHLIFERGAFDSRDTQMASIALRMYLWGLPFYGLYKIFAPTFFSVDRPKVPVFISMAAIAVNIIFCLIMVPHYGFSILALGTSLSMFLNCSLQGLFLARILKLGPSFFFSWRLLKFAIAGGLCWWSVTSIKGTWYLLEGALLERSLGFLGCVALGAFVYISFLLLIGEAKLIKKLLKKK
jgi:putative peptidoglycan lipid II flippase